MDKTKTKNSPTGNLKSKNNSTKIIIITISVLVGLSLIGFGIFLYFRHRHDQQEAAKTAKVASKDPSKEPSKKPSKRGDKPKDPLEQLGLKKIDQPTGYYVLKNFGGPKDGLYLTTKQNEDNPIFSTEGWISLCAGEANLCYWYLDKYTYDSKEYFTLQNVGTSQYMNFKRIKEGKNVKTVVSYLSLSEFEGLKQSGDKSIGNCLFNLYNGKNERTGGNIFVIKLYEKFDTYLFSKQTSKSYELEFNTQTNSPNKIALLEDDIYQWSFESAYNYGLNKESEIGDHCPFNFERNVCKEGTCVKQLVFDNDNTPSYPYGKCSKTTENLNFEESKNNLYNYKSGALGDYIPMTKEECNKNSTYDGKTVWKWISKDDIDDNLKNTVRNINNKLPTNIYNIDKNLGICVFTNCKDTKSANLFKANTICQIDNNEELEGFEVSSPSPSPSPSTSYSDYSYYTCEKNKPEHLMNFPLNKNITYCNYVTNLESPSSESPSSEFISKFTSNELLDYKILPCETYDKAEGGKSSKKDGGFIKNLICSKNHDLFLRTSESNRQNKLKCSKENNFIFGKPDEYSRLIDSPSDSPSESQSESQSDYVYPSKFWKANHNGNLYELCSSHSDCKGNLVCVSNFKNEKIGVCSLYNPDYYNYNNGNMYGVKNDETFTIAEKCYDSLKNLSLPTETFKRNYNSCVFTQMAKEGGIKIPNVCKFDTVSNMSSCDLYHKYAENSEYYLENQYINFGNNFCEYKQLNNFQNPCESFNPNKPSCPKDHVFHFKNPNNADEGGNCVKKCESGTFRCPPYAQYKDNSINLKSPTKSSNLNYPICINPSKQEHCVYNENGIEKCKGKISSCMSRYDNIQKVFNSTNPLYIYKQCCPKYEKADGDISCKYGTCCSTDGNCCSRFSDDGNCDLPSNYTPNNYPTRSPYDF